VIKLNCDLGESFGSWTLGQDAQAMQHIDQANIACGFHAGDPSVMKQTLLLAKEHNVIVGAHPGYPDIVGFGRRSMKCTEAEIISLMHYQIAALDGMAKIEGMEIVYVKPHGALYNDMMADANIRLAIIKAVASYYKPLILMLQATADIGEHRAQAKKYGVTLYAEAFADRCYDDDGSLLKRTEKGAVLNQDEILKQVAQLKQSGTVTTVSGNSIALNPDSLCVHGDNKSGVAAMVKIKLLLEK